VAEATPGAIPAATATRRAVVLVVDDEPIVGAMIARALLAHDVTVVGCARDAVALLEAGRDFDLILSDLMMPVASGMDLHAELARRFPAAAARMVFVSGGAFTPAAAEFLERVPNERLDKPFEIPALRALAERFARSPR
jgi:CheY-like chemotaxis protein